MNLSHLVPTIDLCRKIPENLFEESVLKWCFYGQDPEPFIVERPVDLLCREDSFPAPTLQEIIIERIKISGDSSFNFCGINEALIDLLKMIEEKK